jgi:hypothetical protein
MGLGGRRRDHYATLACGSLASGPRRATTCRRSPV